MASYFTLITHIIYDKRLHLLRAKWSEEKRRDIRCNEWKEQKPSETGPSLDYSGNKWTVWRKQEASDDTVRVRQTKLN